MRQATPTVTVLINLAALIIAAAPGLIYFAARAVLAVWIGFVLGRQDADE
jgi:hypothetical protein